MRRRTLIVDDEAPARRELVRLLAGHDSIAVVAQASSIGDARQALARGQIDLVFLDIQLRAESGFDLVPELAPETDVIFVTAFDQHAVQAFDVAATDYLLKPVVPARLERALRRLSASDERWRQKGLEVPDGALRLRSGRQRLLVQADEIVAITSERDYTRVHLNDGSEHLVHRTMRRWEECLPSRDFVRVHRSAIVNTARIVRIERGPDHKMTIGLDRVEGDFPVSRKLQPRLRFAQ